MNIYALAYGARTKDRSGYTAGVVRAQSEEEAIGFGVKACREYFLKVNGWEGHEAIAVRVPDEWLSLPHPPASRLRPEGTRGDGRTGDGRSEGSEE